MIEDRLALPGSCRKPARDQGPGLRG